MDKVALLLMLKLFDMLICSNKVYNNFGSNLWLNISRASLKLATIMENGLFKRKLI